MSEFPDPSARLDAQAGSSGNRRWFHRSGSGSCPGICEDMAREYPSDS